MSKTKREKKYMKGLLKNSPLISLQYSKSMIKYKYENKKEGIGMKKIKVSKELGKALDFLIKSYERDNDKILKSHSRTSCPWVGKTIEPLNKLSLEDMAKCLIIGYEVEETQEEKILNLYLDRTYNYDFHEGYKVGVEDTLNTFGITVKGINE